MYQIPEYLKLEQNIDLDEIAKKHLKIRGIKTRDNSGFYDLLNVQNRYIEKKPRKVFFSKTLVIPKKVEIGYQRLIETIKKGGDLNIHLSTRIKDSWYNDNLFNRDNLVHFHLGEKIEEKRRSRAKGFIERSGEIAVAMVTSEKVFLLSIEHHENNNYIGEIPKNITKGDLTFYTEKYMKILIEEFPETVPRANIKLETSEKELTEMEKIILRKKNIMVPIRNSNGESVVQLPISGSGRKIEDTIKIKMYKDTIEEDIKNIKNEILLKNKIKMSSEYKIKLEDINFETYERTYIITRDKTIYAKLINSTEKGIEGIIFKTDKKDIKKKKFNKKELISDLGSLIPIYTIL